MGVSGGDGRWCGGMGCVWVGGRVWGWGKGVLGRVSVCLGENCVKEKGVLGRVCWGGNVLGEECVGKGVCVGEDVCWGGSVCWGVCWGECVGEGSVRW